MTGGASDELRSPSLRQLLGQLLFSLGELPGFVTQSSHGIAELRRSLLAEVLVNLLEFSLGAGSGIQSLRELSFAQLFRGVDHSLASLLKLLLRLRHHFGLR